MKPFYQYFWYIFGAGILVIFFIIFSFFSSSVSEMPKENMIENTDITTISPKPYQEKHVLFGAVEQHGYAAISSRRKGIISDIYVDIGEKIEAGQPLAAFFPPGVEGQSSSAIRQKSTRLSKARSNLKTLLNLENESIKIAEQDIQDKKNALLYTTQQNTSLIQNQTSQKDIDQITLAQRILEKAKTSLQTAQDSLIAIKKDGQQKITKAMKHKEEVEKQTWSLVTEIRETLINVFFDDTQLLLERSSIDFQNLSSNYGSLHLESRQKLEQLFRNTGQKNSNLRTVLHLHLELLATAEKVITNSSLGNGITQNTLNAKQNTIIQLRNTALAKQEKLTQAEENLKSIESSENEIILIYNQQITQKEEQIRIAKNNRELATSNLGTSLESATKKLTLLKSSSEQKIHNAQKAVEIAKADLQNAQIAAGHTQLISPFSGTLTKRNIHLGENIQEGNIAFEMIGTENSLSKKSSLQIHFTLPEKWLGTLKLGDEIQVQALYKNTLFEAKIDQISQQIDSISQGYMIQATPVQEDIHLPHGGHVKVIFHNTEPLYYEIPKMAVKRNKDAAFVFLQTDTGIQKHPVEIQAIEGEFAHVMTSFEEDAKIVTSFPDTLLNAQTYD
jgi:RND family efflux transporter MFP subunit